MNGKIKLYIISGFLGAGKTTFLRRMLEGYADEKVGVLINEFGVIGVDGKTISRHGIEYVEVNNGSIFCSCIKADFIKTLVALQKQDIDYLIIENSGLADPSSMNGLLQDIEKLMERGYDYMGSVGIVDCSTFMRYVDMLPPLQNQVIASDLVILNKTDLASADEITKISTRIGAINPNAKTAESVHANVPLSLITEVLTGTQFNGETCNHPWNRPATYALSIRGVYDYVAVRTFITRLSDNALRIKGFIQTNNGWMHIDAVGSETRLNTMEDADDELIAKQGIVIIGKDNAAFDDKITALWNTLMHENPVFIED